MDLVKICVQTQLNQQAVSLLPQVLQVLLCTARSAWLNGFQKQIRAG